MVNFYLIITTSINTVYTEKNEEHRRLRYIESISKTLKLLPNCIKPIIVENNGCRSTYLDNLCDNIFYTDNNKIKQVHKGITELNDIKDTIKQYNIQDEDIVIKLTGRYSILNDSFFNLIINNKEKEAFIKFYNVCELKFMKNDCVLGLFAIKCKYLKNFEYKKLYSPEVEFATYVRNSNIDFIEIQQLGLECCFADDLRILNV